MSRFGNLEFGDQHEDQSSQQVVKDEAFYCVQAQQAFENGEFEQALRLFAKVLEFNPQNPAAWSGQVRMLIELGEFREAKLWADKALEQFPRDPELLAAKAVALARSGDVNEAIAFSDASVEERGDTPYIWLARGDVLLARKERRAEYCFEKALLLAPKSWFYSWLTSRVYAFYRKFSLAFRYAQEALALDAGRAVLWLQAGHCQLGLGLADVARTSYDHARQLNPRSTEIERALIRVSHFGFGGLLRARWRRWFNT